MKIQHVISPPPFDDEFRDDLDIYEELSRTEDPPDEPVQRDCDCEVVEDQTMRELLENRAKNWNEHSVRCVDCEYYHGLTESVTGCKGICGNELEERKFVNKYNYKLCENYRRKSL